MKADRIWATEYGAWRVTAKEYEELWKRASWDARQVVDPKRAWREWNALY